MLDKKTLGILLLSSPYTYQNSETFYELAKSSVEKGYAVKVFIFVDAVNNAKLNQDPDPEVVCHTSPTLCQDFLQPQSHRRCL